MTTEISAHELIESESQKVRHGSRASFQIWQQDFLMQNDVISWQCECRYCGKQFLRRNFKKSGIEWRRNDLEFCSAECRSYYNDETDNK